MCVKKAWKGQILYNFLFDQDSMLTFNMISLMMAILIRITIIYRMLLVLQNHLTYVTTFHPGHIFMWEILLLFYSEEIEVLRH